MSPLDELASDAGFGYTDPAEVCRRFALAIYSADTRHDAGPGDAYERAARYLSRPLAGQSEAAQKDGRWQTWTAHHANLATQVRAVIDELQPLDTAVTAQRTVRVTATAVGADGWDGGTEQALLKCQLRRGGPDGDGWRIADYRLSPTGLP